MLPRMDLSVSVGTLFNDGKIHAKFSRRCLSRDVPLPIAARDRYPENVQICTKWYTRPDPGTTLVARPRRTRFLLPILALLAAVALGCTRDAPRGEATAADGSAAAAPSEQRPSAAGSLLPPPATEERAVPVAVGVPQAAVPGVSGASAEAAAPSAPVAPVATDATALEPVRTCGAVSPWTAPPQRTRLPGPPPVGAAAAVVIDAGSGAVLWGKDERAPLPPASTTKILTALLAVERGNLDEAVPVTLEQRLLSVGSSMGLVTDDWFTLRDLLYGAMLPSGNDAARMIATHLAGSEQLFATHMNGRLCELGLTDSVFLNASGLGRTEFNLASAHDLAQVFRVGMENAAFAKIVSTRAHTARGSRVLPLYSLNEIVFWYPGGDGAKIGWTPGAGSTIVASATRNGHRVVVALLKTPDRSGEAAALLNWAFASWLWQ